LEERVGTDKKGIAISFATEKEMPFVEAIEQLMQQKIALHAMPETGGYFRSIDYGRNAGYSYENGLYKTD